VCFFSHERNTRQTHSEQPLVRFRFPFSVCKLCCAIPGNQPRDDPASTLDPLAAPPEVGCPRADSSMRFYALCPPCAARAAGNHGSHRSGRVIRHGLSFARRSATRMPNLHTTGPDLLRAVCLTLRVRSGNALGIQHPSQFSSLAGPGVYESLRHLCVRDSPPFIPTCRYPMQSAPLIFTVAGARILNSFQASLWKANRLRIDSTGFWVVYRERAEPGVSWRPARPILPWVSGSSLGLAGCFFRARHRAKGFAREPPSAAAFFLWLPSAHGHCVRQ